MFYDISLCCVGLCKGCYVRLANFEVLTDFCVLFFTFFLLFVHGICSSLVDIL